jgi:hypothetical protein
MLRQPLKMDNESVLSDAGRERNSSDAHPSNAFSQILSRLEPDSKTSEDREEQQRKQSRLSLRSDFGIQIDVSNEQLAKAFPPI